MKILVLVIMALSISFGTNMISDGVIGKIKTHEIEGRITPIAIFEVCIEGYVYLVLVEGYKAGMCPKYIDDNNADRVAKCSKKDGKWQQITKTY